MAALAWAILPIPWRSRRLRGFLRQYHYHTARIQTFASTRSIKPLSDATPEDGTLFKDYDGYGLYIRDMALFDEQRALKLPYDTGAAILATPRDVIFGRGSKWPKHWSDRLVIDLVPMAKRLLGKQ